LTFCRADAREQFCALRQNCRSGVGMALLLQVAATIAPVLLLALVGFLWMRLGWTYDAEFVTRLSMTLSMPCLIFMALVRSDVDPGMLRDTVLAALASYLAVGGIVWGLVRGLGLDMATFWAPLTFGNTGNLGLPIALFAFGQAGFDLAVVIFAVMAILSFTFGVWVVAGGGNPVTAVREPLVWGAVAGSIFLALGSALWLCLAKLAICVAAPLAVGLAFGLSRLALGVLILQVATPVAVTSYMLAAKYDARPDEVAGLVVVSTLLAVPAIPLLLIFFV